MIGVSVLREHKQIVRSSELDIAPGEHHIASFIGDAAGPTLIVVGSIHGNEAGGYHALLRMAPEVEKIADRLKGRVYFLAGNTRALQKGVRFIDADLNRSWTARNLSSHTPTAFRSSSEAREMNELLDIFDSILVTAEDEVYAIDLHSTSAEGLPFATVGDTLRNRRFAQKFPISILLGIEEQLDGTMLEYLNNAGAVTLGYEGGQHTSADTIANHQALVWAAMVNTGILESLPDLDVKLARLRKSQRSGKIFEVRYRHAIVEDDEFCMDPGFNNFDTVDRGQAVAHDMHGVVRAPETGLMLMPLYQRLGEDGFFIGRRVAPFWLKLSAILRRLGIQELMPLLPGVRRDPADRDTLIVNTRVARLFPLQVFHLLGFRRRRWSGEKLIVSRRRHDSISPFGRGE